MGRTKRLRARAPDDVGKRTRRKQRPISQNDNQTWLTGLEAVGSAHDGCPQSRFVSVGDREADVYDLLAAARPEGVELVTRASWDRAVCAPERSVWATVEAQSVVEPLLPGAETLWRGFQHLTDVTSMYRLLRSAPPLNEKMCLSASPPGEGGVRVRAQQGEHLRVASCHTLR